MAKETLNPDTMHAPIGAYSQVVVAPPGRLVFISGQAAADRDAHVVGVGDIRAQTRQTLENLKAAVEAVGGTLADIVSVTVFVTELSGFADVHDVRAEYFPDDYPASTLVQVTALAHPDLLIEINAIAVIP